MVAQSFSKMLMYRIIDLNRSQVSYCHVIHDPKWLIGTVCSSHSLYKQLTKLQNVQTISACLRMAYGCWIKCPVYTQKKSGVLFHCGWQTGKLWSGIFKLKPWLLSPPCLSQYALFVSVFFLIQLFPVFHSHLHFLNPLYPSLISTPLSLPILPLLLCNLAG